MSLSPSQAVRASRISRRCARAIIALILGFATGPSLNTAAAQDPSEISEEKAPEPIPNALSRSPADGVPGAGPANGDRQRLPLDWFPGAPLIAPLRVAPREVRIAAGPFLVDRDGRSQLGDLEAEVALGYRLPVVRLRSQRSGLAGVNLGLEGGVFARFSPETSNLGLIESDFRVGFPISVRYGVWDGRAGWVHVSSHLGDDFLSQLPATPLARKTSRDGLELLVARRFGAWLRLYAGGNWNYKVTPNLETLAGRIGAEWHPTGAVGSRVQPYAAVDFEVTDLTGRLGTTGQAGVSVSTPATDLGLSLIAHVGPSPMGHFRRVDENYVGVMLSVGSQGPAGAADADVDVRDRDRSVPTVAGDPLMDD